MSYDPISIYLPAPEKPPVQLMAAHPVTMDNIVEPGSKDAIESPSSFLGINVLLRTTIPVGTVVFFLDTNPVPAFLEGLKRFSFESMIYIMEKVYPESFYVRSVASDSLIKKANR